MVTDNIEFLKKYINSMRLRIESQKESYNRALECLKQTKASLAVTKIVKRTNGESITQKEQVLHESLIKEAYDNVSKQIYTISEMETELRELENKLLFKE